MEFKYTQKLKLNIRNRIFLLLTLFFIVSFTLTFFIILPKINDIKKTRAEISDIRIKIEEKYLSGINAKILSKQAPEVNEKLDLIEGFLIDPDEQINFISSLEAIAEKNNIIQTPRIEYESAVKGKVYNKIPVKISTEGSFENQIKYLKDLTSLDKTISIESLNIKLISSPKDSEDVYVSFFITANTFWVN